MTWHPIETAPKDGTEIILSDGRYKRAGYWSSGINVWVVDAVTSLPMPKYWLPLPILFPEEAK